RRSTWSPFLPDSQSGKSRRRRDGISHRSRSPRASCRLEALSAIRSFCCRPVHPRTAQPTPSPLTEIDHGTCGAGANRGGIAQYQCRLVLLAGYSPGVLATPANDEISLRLSMKRRASYKREHRHDDITSVMASLLGMVRI